MSVVTISRRLARGDLSRKIFAEMLWRAFPSPSQAGVAKKAAPVLGISERQVRRLLNCDCSAKVEHVLAVAVLVGFEAVLARLDGK